LKRVRLLRDARKDLDALWRFVADNSGSTQAADHWIDEIIQQISRLGLAPKAGVPRPDLADGFRVLPFGVYLIYYTDSPRGVAIRRVIHGARDQKKALKLN
jgi:toxin ParE1/3/4